jgi:hypothetical protein
VCAAPVDEAADDVLGGRVVLEVVDLVLQRAKLQRSIMDIGGT